MNQIHKHPIAEASTAQVVAVQQWRAGSEGIGVLKFGEARGVKMAMNSGVLSHGERGEPR